MMPIQTIHEKARKQRYPATMHQMSYWTRKRNSYFVKSVIF